MERKKVGLALSGGAARGFAHVGVLKAFKENGIPIDFIAGTSAGSFAGGAFAAGMSVDSILELGRNMSWYKVSGLSFSAKGLISNAPIAAIIKDKFPFHQFEDLMIPFAAVATDLETGTEVVFKDKGDIGFAICASCAIPGIFAPLQDKNGKLYIDGGVVAPVPTNAVREMGADIVIAVDVISSGATYWGKPSTLVGIILQSALMLLRTASVNQHYQADAVIIPPIAHLRPDDIGKMDEYVKLGEKAGLEKLDEIRALIFGDAEKGE
ncbi:MAG: patatin-like phospholipase family protein [Acidobacteria bacterium]|nr:patatin-like phospholipase family protein [Acidobacteriota bacterium]